MPGQGVRYATVDVDPLLLRDQAGNGDVLFGMIDCTPPKRASGGRSGSHMKYAIPAEKPLESLRDRPRFFLPDAVRVRLDIEGVGSPFPALLMPRLLQPGGFGDENQL